MTPLQLSHLRAVVFDWAGTVIDFGSHAPMGAFVALFAQEGITISIAEARGPMGLPKWHHIEALVRLPHVALAWRQRHGRDVSDADIDRLYDIFTPMNAAVVADHAALVPGTAQTVAALRAAGLKIGSTTGYNRPIATVMLPLAAKQGFAPDNLVCADDLPESRPAPFGMYRCFMELGVWPAHTVVKVDDTVPGLLEGTHAGCWTVGVTASGNEMGLTWAEWSALDAQDKDSRRAQAGRRLQAARPDYLIDTVADLPPVIIDIDQRLQRGERPGTGGPAPA
ncbi:MAG: phosphonoacetaldehyde hydrolase [Burkholderiaceae bacterium]|nr:phosphonoacetaldehyde hydrolase [Burkholderiaceae bacterium]